MTVMKFCKFFCGMFLGLMLLVTANQAEAMNPQGYFDFVQSNTPNQIRVRGWAFDRDNVNHKVRIHVYVGGSVGANVPSYEIRADKFRPDVNRAFPGVGDYHGFDSTINVDTSRTGNQAIYIYALNDVGSGTFVELGSKPVNIKTASINRVTNHNPQGRVFQVDSPSNNTLHVKGTAWDDDNPSGTVRVHVYVGGTPGSNVPQYEIRADRANHEFEDTRNIGNSKTGSQTVHVYALNDYGPGTFQEIWTGNVNIKGVEKFDYPLSNTYVCGNNWGTYYSAKGNKHLGIDIKSNSGDDNVYAPASGQVVQTGWNKANGNTITIKHNINGQSIYTFYGHLASISVSRGANVHKGQKIGIVGNTGSSTTGKHLHFAITTQTSAGVWGYGSVSGNIGTKNGYRFYNPHYVVQNNRLP